MPKVNRDYKPPVVRKTPLGSTCAEQGDYRIVLHDKQYTCSISTRGWHRERFVKGVGWIICDELPEAVENALRYALGIDQ